MTEQQVLELITAAQQGNLDAESQVLEEYMPLARATARCFDIIGCDGDDLVQLAMIGLMKAVRTYKIDGGASFKTYASCCMRNSVSDAVRRSSARGRSGALEQLELDEQVLPAGPDPGAQFLEEESAKMLLETIEAALTPAEAEVLRLYLDAASYDEISKKLGIERKKVDNTIYNLRKKIKKLLDAHDK